MAHPVAVKGIESANQEFHNILIIRNLGINGISAGKKASHRHAFQKNAKDTHAKTLLRAQSLLFLFKHISLAHIQSWRFWERAAIHHSLVDMHVVQ